MKCHFGKQQKTITHTEIWTMSQTIQLDVFLQGFCKKYRDKDYVKPALCETERQLSTTGAQRESSYSMVLRKKMRKESFWQGVGWKDLNL